MAPKTSSFILLAAILINLLSSPCVVADNNLYSGSSLYGSQSISYGTYYLTMQNDCNLVLYDSTRPVWATNTGSGRGTGCRATLQNDGNFVLYNNRNKVLWASGTVRGDGDYVLILEPSGDLVIYANSIWIAGINALGTRVPISGDQGSGSSLELVTSRG